MSAIYCPEALSKWLFPSSLQVRKPSLSCHPNTVGPRAVTGSAKAILCRVLIPKPIFQRLDLLDSMPDDLWMEVHGVVQQTRIKTTPKKKKCKKAKCLSGEHLIHFEFSFAYGIRKGCGYSFTAGWSSFPAPLVKEIVFSLLYILASFVKIMMSIGVRIHL